MRQFKPTAGAYPRLHVGSIIGKFQGRSGENCKRSCENDTCSCINLGKSDVAYLQLVINDVAIFATRTVISSRKRSNLQ